MMDKTYKAALSAELQKSRYTRTVQLFLRQCLLGREDSLANEPTNHLPHDQSITGLSTGHAAPVE